MNVYVCHVYALGLKYTQNGERKKEEEGKRRQKVASPLTSKC